MKSTEDLVYWRVLALSRVDDMEENRVSTQSYGCYGLGVFYLETFPLHDSVDIFTV